MVEFLRFGQCKDYQEIQIFLRGCCLVYDLILLL